MGNPTSTTDYPGFSGATGKRDMLREIWAVKGNQSATMDLLFRISNTDFNALTDKSTVYVATDMFESA